MASAGSRGATRADPVLSGRRGQEVLTRGGRDSEAQMGVQSGWPTRPVSRPEREEVFFCVLDQASGPEWKIVLCSLLLKGVESCGESTATPLPP